MSDVTILMGSDSGWPTVQAAAEALEESGVSYRADMMSVHRMPKKMVVFGRSVHEQGFKVTIAGAGGAVHLPRMLAALTPLPVIGVPVVLRHFDGMDSLLSIVQMPAGVLITAVTVDNTCNAGLLAVRTLAAGDKKLRAQMVQFQTNLRDTARAKGGVMRRASSGN